MAEYITKETAISTFLKYCICEPRQCEGCEELTEFKSLTAADVVEVVRCKDCCHAVPGAAYAFWCSFHDEGTEGDCFCSYGERRTADGQDR